MNASILVVDDDTTVVEVVSSTFRKNGCKVRHAKDADAAFAALKDGTFDLMVLDIGLPGISGMNLLQILRQDPKMAAVPVILLTSRGAEKDKLQGLNAGADDYLVKPFSSKELLARAQAVLRRASPATQPGQTLEADELRVDLDRREVIIADKRILLTPVEFDLLAHFLDRKGYVLPYAALAEALARHGREMTSETLYVHVNSLRKKLGELGQRIETIYGIGYKFVP